MRAESTSIQHAARATIAESFLSAELFLYTIPHI